MPRKLVRALGPVLAAAVGVLTLLVAAPPATAANPDLGWVRLQPASGKTDIAVLALTQSACPGGKAVTVRLVGPGIPADAGNLVGVTAYSAFDPTLTGQLWIPLSFTFRDWANINGVKLKKGFPYTITVVCRDLLRSSLTSGSFTGRVVFDGKNGYRAQGAAAQPFNTALKPEDPFALPTAAPSPGATAGSTATPAPSASAAVSQPAPAGSQPGATQPTAGEPSASGSAGAQQPSATAPVDATVTDSTSRNVLLGLAVLLLAGLGVGAFVRRPRASDEATGSRERIDMH